MLEGFEPVKTKYQRMMAKIDKNGNLFLPLTMLIEECSDLNEAYYSVFYKPDEKHMAVVFSNAASGYSVKRPTNRKKGSLTILLRNLYRQYGFACSRGISIEMTWDKENRVMMFDMANAIHETTETGRAMRTVA